MVVDTPHLLGCIGCFFAAALIAVIEAAYLFRDTAGIGLYCKKVLGAGFVAAGIAGVVAYVLLWAGANGGVYQIEHEPPNAFMLFLMALAVLQGLERLEITTKGDIPGGRSVPETLESLNAKIKRMFRSYLFRRLIYHMPQDSTLRSLLRNSLPKVYSPTETIAEYETWIAGLEETKRQELDAYRRQSAGSKKLNEEMLSGILLNTLVHHGISQAIYLAGRRASAIVDAEAFR